MSGGAGDGRSHLRLAAKQRQSVGVVFGGCEPHAGANARQVGMGHAAVSPAEDREVSPTSTLQPPASPSPVPDALNSTLHKSSRARRNTPLPRKLVPPSPPPGLRHTGY